MANVYWSSIDNNTTTEEVQAITRRLLDTLVERESVKLEKKIPLKVHFGEKGNITYIRSQNYLGVIDWLKEREIASCYMETTVLYGGQRYRKDLHLKTAAEHGFDQLPVVIADGEEGGDFTEVRIDKPQFETCKIAREFADYEQLLVLAHFKGHRLSGFGGAIKQLSMGFAAKGGKMAMHMGIKPVIVNRKCKRCNLCVSRCAYDAITIGPKSFIDHDKCVGCGACVSICPHHAATVVTVRGASRMVASMLANYGVPFIRDSFQDRLVEYAYAAQLGKRHIYMNFAMNLTPGCDCEGRKMRPLIDDFGVFISADPVSIDKACHDMATQRGAKFKGAQQFDYAQKIGFGEKEYTLVEVKG